MKRIALLGGSFNPPHIGHFECARYIYKTLHPDEIWFLFSYNTDKNRDGYAPLEDRMNMASLLAQHYTDVPIVLSNIQDEIGTHITADVLKIIKDKFPHHEFIWVMGADSMTTIHTWEDYDTIFKNGKVAVMKREGYLEKALGSPSAKEFYALEKKDVKDFLSCNNGWMIMDNPLVNLSSTSMRESIRQGKMTFSAEMQDIGNYIRNHKLYQ